MDLVVEKLSFSYDAKKSVLNDVSFRVSNGKALAIVGPSGCGKSTLLRLICRLLPASRAQTVNGGIRIGEADNIGKLTRLGQVGFIFQEPNLFPHLTVKENIRLPLDIIGDGTVDLSLVDRLLGSVGLDDCGDVFPRVLSTGMKTRAMLARTFATKPRILLLDEPFSALDIGWRTTLYQILQNLRKTSPATTLLVTHDIQEALLLCDRIIVLSGTGSLIKEVRVPVPLPSDFNAATINTYLAEVFDIYLSIQEDLVRQGADRNENNPFLDLNSTHSSPLGAT